MTAQRHRIVVALDLSEYSEIVLEHALDQAARQSAPDLHVLHVVRPSETDIERFEREIAALVLPALEELDCTDWRVRIHVRAGDPAEEIASLAAEQCAHLIVVGRFGVHGRRLGAVARKLIDLSPCPTLIIGLTDHGIEADEQCPDCVVVRAESDGARWFCAAHVAPDRVRLTTLVGPGATLSGGGP